jgi:lipopolysaccharide export LptBFGC system permease protein LptF
MSSDGEITAMRAAGVPSRRVIAPVLFYSMLAMAAAAVCSLYLQPFALREQYRIRNQGIAQQLTAAIEPRVFQEQFSGQKLVLYVRDVTPSASAIAEWKDVFIADTSPPEERSKEGREYGEAPTITIAATALAAPDPAHNTIQLSMNAVNTHAVDRDPTFYYNTSAPHSDQMLAVNQKTEEAAKRIQAMDTRPLLEEVKRTGSAESRIELHQRLALPVACVLLALVGIPLGAASRKTGRGGAFVVTVFLAFLYYMSLVSLIGLAQQGKLRPELAAWGPNVVFGLIGIALVIGIDRAGDRDTLSRLRAVRDRAWASLKERAKSSRSTAEQSVRSLPRIPLVPGIVDTYVLSTFLFYFATWLAAFVMLAHIYIFFDLLGDFMSHAIALPKVVSYHVFLTPQLIYQSAPMAVLAAVLMTFAVMSKNNEVTAMKACGVSLYRLSAPVIIAAGLVSGALFLFDHYYIPQSNRIQESLLAEIKGRPPQTFLNPNRKFVNGQDPRKPRIYNFKYYDRGQNLMVGVNVYELAESPFRLIRHVSAESARWEKSFKSWVFSERLGARFRRRRIEGLQDVPSDHVPGNGRAARLFPGGREAGKAAQLPGARALHPRSAAVRIQHRAPAGAVSQEVFRADVRAGDRPTCGTVLIHDRQSGSDGGSRRKPGNRAGVLRTGPPLRRSRQRESVAGGHGGMVPRRGVRDGWDIYVRPHANVVGPSLSLRRASARPPFSV